MLEELLGLELELEALELVEGFTELLELELLEELLEFETLELEALELELGLLEELEELLETELALELELEAVELLIELLEFVVLLDEVELLEVLGLMIAQDVAINVISNPANIFLDFTHITPSYIKINQNSTKVHIKRKLSQK